MDARCPAAAHQEDIAVDPARRSHLAGLGHWIDAHRLHAMATRGAGYRPSGQHFDPTRLRATDEMVGNVPPYVHDRGDANAGLGQVAGGNPRSEDSRDGKECVSTISFRGSPAPLK